MFLLFTQLFTAGIFTMAGMMKLMMPKKKMEKKMPWAKEYSEGQIKAIGFFELLGVLGITLPIWLDVFPWLAPIAAIGLMTITVLAVNMHVRRKETGSALFALLAAISALIVFWQTASFLGL